MVNCQSDCSTLGLCIQSLHCHAPLQAYSSREFTPSCVDQTENGFPFLCGYPKAEIPPAFMGCSLYINGKLSNPGLRIKDGTYSCESFSFSHLLQIRQATIQLMFLRRPIGVAVHDHHHHTFLVYPWLQQNFI